MLHLPQVTCEPIFFSLLIRHVVLESYKVLGAFSQGLKPSIEIVRTAVARLLNCCRPVGAKPPPRNLTGNSLVD